MHFDADCCSVSMCTQVKRAVSFTNLGGQLEQFRLKSSRVSTAGRAVLPKEVDNRGSRLGEQGRELLEKSIGCS
jgi:hypothetical protein